MMRGAPAIDAIRPNAPELIQGGRI